MKLARATCERPAHLSPRDVEPLRALVGEEALDYVMVVGAFHFINRIADLLGVDPELLPAPARRIEPLRRLGVWAASRIMARLDLANRRYERSYEQALADMAPTFEEAVGRVLSNEFEPVRTRPKIIEVVRLAIAERDRSSLGRETVARIQHVVQQALPRDRDDVEGLHVRPDDPIEAFAFVGTRYPARTTRAMIDRLRSAGAADETVLELAVAVADANQWARIHRLLGLDPAIFYLAEAGVAAQAVA